ncbi:hypothetical protein EZV62_025497 [Acer yangbiense]|uniref:Uncharacterized protein n=1 Tax=Acer yangbiense TaxID=1000413 RepID=A0A5C7GZ66_9ROSI|nr:hypothetical protein EZV62_025497 [Acer yangbiense]
MSEYESEDEPKSHYSSSDSEVSRRILVKRNAEKNLNDETSLNGDGSSETWNSCKTPSSVDEVNRTVVEGYSPTLSSSKNKGIPGSISGRTQAISRAIASSKVFRSSPLGVSVVDKSFIPYLTSLYDIPPSIVLNIPPDGYDPTNPEQGDLPLPICAFDQGLRLPLHPFVRKLLVGLEIAPFQLGPFGWRNIIGLYVMWMEDDKGNPIPLGKKPEGGWQLRWVIARGSWGKTVKVKGKKKAVPTCFNYEGSWSRITEWTDDFEKKLARVVDRKKTLKWGDGDIKDPSRLIDTGFWGASSSTHAMTSANLKIPKRIDPAILKRFCNSDSNCEPPVPSSAGGKVSSAGGSSNLILPGDGSSKVVQSNASSRKRKAGKEVADEDLSPHLKAVVEKLNHIFPGKKYDREVDSGVEHLMEQVMSSLGENFVRCFLLEQNFASQTASFRDGEKKSKADLSELREELKKLRSENKSLVKKNLDLTSVKKNLEAETKKLAKVNDDFAAVNEELANSFQEFCNGYFLAQSHVVKHGSPDWDLNMIPKWDREVILKETANREAAEKAGTDEIAEEKEESPAEKVEKDAADGDQDIVDVPPSA